MRRFKQILIASDFSPTSKGALATAAMFAKAFRSELIMIHVIEPIVPPAIPAEILRPGVLDGIEADTRRWAERQIARLAKVAQRSSVSVKTVLLSGDPAYQIVRAARTYHADLVVVGTHARRGMAKMLLGSVAAHVLANAPCPVVTVRTA